MKLRNKIGSLGCKLNSNHYSKRLFFTFYFLLFIAFISNAQVSINQLGTTYIENFDGMGTGPNAQATLPNGFKYGADWNFTLNTTTASAGTSGTNNVISSIAGLYNFCYGDNNTSTDRALGFFTNSLSKSPRSILFAFTNNTGSTVTKVTLFWNYEKYRNGSLGTNWSFYHGNTSTYTYSGTTAINSASITNTSTANVSQGMSVSGNPISNNLTGNTLNSLTIVTGNPLGTSIPISPNPISTTANSLITYSWTAATPFSLGNFTYPTGVNADPDFSPVINPISNTISVTIPNLNIPDGSTYYLRWMFNSGSNTLSNGRASGIDDFSIKLDDDRCEPYRQAQLNSITVGSPGTLDVNYTRGNGNNVLIVASTSATPTAPVNGTSYTANQSFGTLGTALGAGFVVYNGPGNGANLAHTVNVTNLNSSTPYYFYIYEYNNSGLCYHRTVVSGSGYFTGATDYFRSRASGNWNIPATWESSKDSITWVNSLVKPDSLSKGITIRMPDSVLIAGVETAKNLSVSSGAILSYNTTVATAGSTLTIANDPANEFDFNIYGRYIVFGNPATLMTGARVKIFNGGLIRADGNSTGLSDNLVFNSSVYFTNGSVFEWNNISPFNFKVPGSNPAQPITYFNYLGSQPQSDIPIFRITVAPNTAVGSAVTSPINGLLEVNDITRALAFQGDGHKVIRNGIIGRGNINQGSSIISKIIIKTN